MSKLPRGPHWFYPDLHGGGRQQKSGYRRVPLFTLEDIKREYAELMGEPSMCFVPELMAKYAAKPEPVKLKVGDRVAIMAVGSEGFCVEIGGRLAVAWDDHNWQRVDKLVPVVRVNPGDPPDGVEVQP